MPPAKTSSGCRSKSICQKSGEIAVTLTKISSLYLAAFLLPQSRKPATKPQLQRQPPTADKVSRRASYLMEPDEAVDAQADEYIRRRRLSIFRHIDDGVRNEASKCIPPPPPPKNKWSASATSGGYRHPY
ncbi:hypothetical protein MA16_Dca027366 [Dendrobium catenatum]|uniref:Uncharacterized protein n=1 Tax=Dendrobium catenatum TaxID=906689 RepID=A0A2I0VPB3_9ASPA|nr:hypothetical protein MA16_Dca027366 [Dendrobium catenatum]